MARQLHVTREVRVLACIIGLALMAGAAVPAHAAPDALPGYDGGQVNRDAATVAAHESDSYLLALWRLSRAGAPAADAYDELVSATKDKDWRVRWLAVEALGRMICNTGFEQWCAKRKKQRNYPSSVDGIGSLCEALGDDEWEVRAAAARGLRDCGAEAVDYRVVKKLVEAAGDAHPEVTEPITTLLSQVVQRKDGPLGDVLEAMDASKLPKYWDALQALEEGHRIALYLGEDDKDNPLLPAWLKLRGEQDAEARRQHVLDESFSRAGAAAVPQLQNYLCWDWQHQLEAVRALRVIGPAAAEAVPLLGEYLSDKDEHLAWAAMDALQAIGPAATPAAKQIVEYIAHPGYADDRDLQLLGSFGSAAGVEAAGLLADLAIDPMFGKVARESLQKIAPTVGRAAEDLWQHKGQGTTEEGRTLAAATTPEERRRVIQQLMEAEPPPPQAPVLPSRLRPSEAQAWFDAFIAGKCTPRDYDLARVLPLLDAIPDDAIPRLWEELPRDPWSEDAIVKVLVEHDPQACTKFIDWYRGGSDSLDRVTCKGLVACGPAAKELAPELLKTALDEKASLWQRMNAAQILEAIGPSAKADAGALMKACKSAYAKTGRLTVADLSALTWPTAAVEQAVPDAKGAYSKLADQLALTAGAAGPQALEALEGVAQGGLNDGRTQFATYLSYHPDPLYDQQTRRAAIIAIGRMGPAALEEDMRKHPPRRGDLPGLGLARLLIDWLTRDRDPSDWFGTSGPNAVLLDRCAAAEALGQLGCTHDSVIRALLEAALDETPAPPEPPDPSRPRDPWKEKLKPSDPPLHRAAVEALSRLAGWK